MSTKTWVLICILSMIGTVLVMSRMKNRIKGCSYEQRIGGLKGKTYILVSCDALSASKFRGGN